MNHNVQEIHSQLPKAPFPMEQPQYIPIYSLENWEFGFFNSVPFLSKFGIFKNETILGANK